MGKCNKQNSFVIMALIYLKRALAIIKVILPALGSCSLGVTLVTFWQLFSQPIGHQDRAFYI